MLVTTLQSLSDRPKLRSGKRSTRHQARDAALHSSSSAHGSEEKAGLSGESGESGALIPGITRRVAAANTNLVAGIATFGLGIV